MTEQEKYEKWKKVAFLMAEEKKAFLDKPIEKVEKNGINIRKTKSSRV